VDGSRCSDLCFPTTPLAARGPGLLWRFLIIVSTGYVSQTVIGHRSVLPSLELPIMIKIRLTATPMITVIGVASLTCIVRRSS
jgi:hypothetical protein